MKKYEIIFLSAVGIGTFIIFGNMNGFGFCLYPFVMLTILFIGLKVFPDKSKNEAEKE